MLKTQIILDIMRQHSHLESVFNMFSFNVLLIDFCDNLGNVDAIVAIIWEMSLPLEPGANIASTIPESRKFLNAWCIAMVKDIT